jgi:protein-tyrosine-phosphatase
MEKKVLFVCRANTGRSQVAEELYNLETKSKNAQSAGTLVNQSIKTVGEVPNVHPLLDAMQMYGIDLSKNVKKQLKIDDLDNYDKIIVMAEPENIPEWLSNHPNYEYWEIEDIKDKNLGDAASIIETIHERVKTLISQQA